MSRSTSESWRASATHRTSTLIRKIHAFERPSGCPPGPFFAPVSPRPASRCCAVKSGSLAIFASDAPFSSDVPLVWFFHSRTRHRIFRKKKSARYASFLKNPKKKSARYARISWCPLLCLCGGVGRWRSSVVQISCRIQCGKWTL